MSSSTNPNVTQDEASLLNALASNEYFDGGFEEKMTFEEACLILGLSEAYVKLV